jgi:RNA polymerase sigma-70 factor (ECF subfamily)
LIFNYLVKYTNRLEISKRFFLYFFATLLKFSRSYSVNKINQPNFLNTKQLIQKCKSNNYEAQIQVYNSYKNMMYGVAVRILKSREEAEDIVQDCFIKAFEKISQLNDDANLGAWLKRIVINKSLDVAKSKHKFIISDDYELLENKVEEKNDEVNATTSVQQIKQCIADLKDKYRIVLSLYLIEDYNHREIAEMLNTKESTIRNQFRRGKQQLLEMIKKQEV